MGIFYSLTRRVKTMERIRMTGEREARAGSDWMMKDVS